MKKLVLLPAENHDNSFIFEGDLCHLYMVDTELNLLDENWFINGYGHVNCLGYCDADQIHTGSKNEVIIASTDPHLGLNSIPKDMVDMFVEHNGIFDIVSYFTTIDGGLDYTLQADLSSMSKEDLDKLF